MQAVLRRIQRDKHKDEDPESLMPHYEEGRIFLASLLPAPPPPATALEVTG